MSEKMHTNDFIQSLGFTPPPVRSRGAPQAHPLSDLIPFSEEVTREDFQGKIVVPTGAFANGFSRKKTLEAICQLGAIPKDELSKTTSILIVGELGSGAWREKGLGSKLKKAIQMIEKNIPIRIISEPLFLSLLEPQDDISFQLQ